MSGSPGERRPTAEREEPLSDESMPSNSARLISLLPSMIPPCRHRLKQLMLQRVGDSTLFNPGYPHPGIVVTP
jgi:hypothetical protein